MLLKCCHTEKMKATGNTQKRSTVGTMKPASVSVSAPRVQRKAVRGVAVKRSQRAVKEETRVDPICDNSNDSGLGFEQHQEYSVAMRLIDWPGDRLGLNHEHSWASENSEVKRKRMEIKIESDDANDNFTFSDSVRQRTQHLLSSPPYPVVEHMSAPNILRPIKRRPASSVMSSHIFSSHKDNSKPLRSRAPGSNVLTSQLLGLNKTRGKAMPSLVTNQMSAVSRYGKTQLLIVSQPEQQHRARYQTEGSRGAVKDRTGNSFPQVQLTGWTGTATLEVYIGSDCGKVVPHMFYQACRVSGKNSTQCQERTDEGTVIIEIPFEPAKDNVVTCDCVGILKERNVDVEHRFPDQPGSRSKKKSTRCRMVFRTLLTHPDGNQETLQICSQPIACTQPPGVPEICKKSLSSSPSCGGLELFILGKNFLKDTRVLFTNSDLQPPWEVSVVPDKEYLQQSHLVCIVPPYQCTDISEPATVRLTVVSSDKSSEAHCFTYTPQTSVGTVEPEIQSAKLVHPGVNAAATDSEAAINSLLTDTANHSHSTLGAAVNSVLHKSLNQGQMEPTFPPRALQYYRVEPKQGGEKDSIFPLVLWKSGGSDGAKLMSMSSKGKDLKLFSLPTVRKNMQLVKPPALVPLLSRGQSSGEEVERKSDQGLLPTELKGVDLRVKPAVGDGVLPVAPSLKIPMATGADLSSAQSPSMATLRRFVANDTGCPLPSLSVENFLSHLEQKAENPKNSLKEDIPSQVGCKLLGGNTATTQPEYVPLESVLSRSVPLVNQARTLPGFQQLSEEKITDVVQPLLDADSKPCSAGPVNTLHYTSQGTTSSEPSGNTTVMSVANLLQNVSQQRVKFCSQAPNLVKVEERVSVSDVFLSQNVTSSSSMASCSSASHQQIPTSVPLGSHVETSVRDVNDLRQPSIDMRAPATYNKENESSLALQDKNTKCATSLVACLIGAGCTNSNGEGLHSPPPKSEDRTLSQQPTFRDCNDHIASELPSDDYNLFLNSSAPVSVNSFVTQAGRTSVCLPPVGANSVSEPSQQDLPQLGNNHDSVNFSPPAPVILHQGSPSLCNGYIVSDVPLSSCSPPIAVQSTGMQVHSQASPVYTDYVQGDMSLTSVCHPQMPKKNTNTLTESCSPHIEVFGTKCQTLENVNSSTMLGSAENCTLHVTAAKTENVFDMKDQVITAAGSVHMSNEHATVCSPNVTPVYSFTTDATRSLSTTCISSPNCSQLNNKEHSNTIEKTDLITCIPSSTGDKYNVVHIQDSIMNSSVTSVVPEDRATAVSIDTRDLESGLRHDLAVTTSLCPLSSTVNNMLVGRNHLTTLLESPGCPPASKDNVSTSMNVSNLLLQTAVTMDSGSRVSTQCPSSMIVMKDVILDGTMLSNEKNCIPVVSSIAADTRPVLHAYTEMCANSSSQVAVMRADTTSTVCEQTISRPEPVVSGTARLDALVNSTLEDHIQAATSVTTNQHSKLEVTSADLMQHCTASATLTNSLLDNMFSLNNCAESVHVQSVVAPKVHSEMARDDVHEVSSASKRVRSTSSAEASSGGGFQTERVVTDSNVGFAAVPGSARFGITSGMHFASAPEGLHFTNVSSNSGVLGLGQLMDLQRHDAKAEETQKHTHGLVVGQRIEAGMLSQELTQMSDHDLISYINPSCFDQV